MTQAKKTPSWLTLSADGVIVKLSKPAEANGVKVDSLSLRAPTVRDVRAAQAAAGGDEEQHELILLSSLAEVSQKDLEALLVKDYNRLQSSYFRLVRDDEL